jgi:hydroxymethylglutaryl-CoA reductase
VGGTLKSHAGARLAQRILGAAGASSGGLAMIIGSAGLASNLAALRALATDGIQRGHMALHRRSVELVREQEARVLGCEGRAAAAAAATPGGASGQAGVPISAGVSAPGGSA